MNPCRRHVRNVHLHVVKVMIDARRPTADVSVAKILRDADDGEQLHFTSALSQVALEPRQINLSVRWYILGSTGCENRLSLDVVSRRQILRHERILKWNRNRLLRSDVRSVNIRDRRRQKVV